MRDNTDEHSFLSSTVTSRRCVDANRTYLITYYSMIDSLVFVSKLSRFQKMINQILLIEHDSQESMTSLSEVKKRFSQRDSLFRYRLVKRAIFICNRYTLEKTSKQCLIDKILTRLHSRYLRKQTRNDITKSNSSRSIFSFSFVFFLLVFCFFRHFIYFVFIT